MAQNYKFKYILPRPSANGVLNSALLGDSLTERGERHMLVPAPASVCEIIDVKEEPMEAFYSEYEESESGGEEVSETEEASRLKDLCRLCAQNSGNMVDIFGTEGLQCQVQTKINNCLPVKVAEGDDLPLRVCRRCLSLLEVSHELNASCLHAETTLRCLQRESQHLPQNVVSLSEDISMNFMTEREENEDVTPYIFCDSSLDASDNDNRGDSTSQQCDPLDNNLKSVFKCSVCNNEFLTPQELSSHCKCQHSSLTCETCCKTFSNNELLMEHTNNGTCTKQTILDCEININNITNYECILCLKNYDSILNYQNHFLESCNHNIVVSNESTAELPQYPLILPQPLNMNVVATDSNKDLGKLLLYQCKICGLKLKSKLFLKKHYRNIHKTLLCVVCLSFQTSSSKEFEKHSSSKCKIDEKNPDLHLPEYADLSLTNYKLHVFNCLLCAKVVSKLKELKEHYVIVHKKFFCSICMNFYSSDFVQFNKHCESHSSELVDEENESKKETQTMGNLIGVFQFECKKCCTKLKTKYSLKKHYEIEHQIYFCLDCESFESDDIGELNSHIKNHCPKKVEFTSLKSFECQKCGLLLSSNYALQQHELVDCNPNPTLIVPTAGEKSSELECKQYRCNICINSYNQFEPLKEHCRRVHKIYMCAVCFISINMENKIELKEHKSMHGNSLRSFQTAGEKSPELKCKQNEHKLKHGTYRVVIPTSVENSSKQKEHKCNLCVKSYNQFEPLKEHCRRVHKIYICSLCFENIDMYNKIELWEHKSRHGNSLRSIQTADEKSPAPEYIENEHNCNLCAQTYDHFEDLKEHCKKVHKTFICTICFAKINMYNKIQIREHKLSHRKKSNDGNEFVCQICSKKYNSQSGLKAHMHSIHLKTKAKYTCSTCDKKFLLKHRFMVHVAGHNRVVTCNYCDKTFQKVLYLNSHIEAVHSQTV